MLTLLSSNWPCLAARVLPAVGLLATSFELSAVQAAEDGARPSSPRGLFQKRAIDRPPSGLRTEPVAKLRRTVGKLATTAATAAPSPPRRIGTRPPGSRRSYFSLTPAVISVRIIPGRTSNTPIPSAAKRNAKSLTAIASAALDKQYSPRSIEAMVAETEETKTMLCWFSADEARPSIRRAVRWVRKKEPLRLT